MRYFILQDMIVLHTRAVRRILHEARKWEKDRERKRIVK